MVNQNSIKSFSVSVVVIKVISRISCNILSLITGNVLYRVFIYMTGLTTERLSFLSEFSIKYLFLVPGSSRSFYCFTPLRPCLLNKCKFNFIINHWIYACGEVILVRLLPGWGCDESECSYYFCLMILFSLTFLIPPPHLPL